jgi:hypothetical protein
MPTESSDRSIQAALDTLVRKLDRKIDLHWVEEMRLGKRAYDHLVGRVRDKTLTRHQLTNALAALFRLRGHGSEEEVFALFRDHTIHPEIRVRTRAVTLVIGMMRLQSLRPPFDVGSSIDWIKAGITLGLYAPAASLAIDFLEKPSPFLGVQDHLESSPKE